MNGLRAHLPAPQKTYARVVHALETGRDPIAAAKAFTKNAVKSITSDLLKRRGYDDLYGDRELAEEDYAKSILNGLYEVICNHDDHAYSEPFNIVDALGHSRKYQFIKSYDTIILCLQDTADCHDPANEYQAMNRETIEPGMNAIVERATALAQELILNPACASDDYSQYEIELAGRSEIQLKAAQRITDQFFLFRPADVIKGARHQVRLSPNVRHPITEIIDDVTNHKNISAEMARELACHVTDKKNKTEFSPRALQKSMLWVFKQRAALIPKDSNTIMSPIMKGRVNNAIEYIFQNHKSYAADVLTEALDYLLPPEPATQVLNDAINCVASNHHDFEEKCVDKAMQHILNQPTLFKDHIEHAIIHILANDKDFSQADVALAVKHINDQADDFVTQHCALYIAKNQASFSSVVFIKAIDALLKAGITKAAITENEQTQLLEVDTPIGKFCVEQTLNKDGTTLTVTLNGLACSNGGFSDIKSLQEYLNKEDPNVKAAAAIEVQKNIRFFRATKIAEEGGEVPALRDASGMPIAYNIPTPGGLNWVAVPEKLPPPGPGAKVAEGTFKTLTHRDKNWVGLTLKTPTSDIPDPFMRTTILNHRLTQMILPTKVNRELLLAPNLGEGDLMELINEGSFTFEVSKFKDLAVQIRKLHDLGVAHRDIKLENLFSIDGIAYLSDFDTAAEVGTFTSIAGTPGYVMPTIQKVMIKYERLYKELPKLSGVAYAQQFRRLVKLQKMLVAFDNDKKSAFNSFKKDQFAFFTSMMIAWAKKEPEAIHGDPKLIHDFVQQMPCSDEKKLELNRFLNKPESSSLSSPLDSYF